ncbi:MAG: hypothetical protein WBQ86_06840 [Candidatus Binatus sp.]
MKTDHTSPPAQVKWPFDLRVFAALAGLWALCLAAKAFVGVGELDVVDPIETIFAGIRFNGDDARLVLIVESGIFAAMALGIFTHRRWGLLLALCYMVQVVMSHLAFVIAYMQMRQEWMNVRAVASQGPMMVLITLYLWIRACDLIFDLQPANARPQTAPAVNHRTEVRADSSVGDIAATAK